MTIKLFLLNLLILTSSIFSAIAQSNSLFTKKFDLKTNVSSERHNTLVIDHNSKVLSATLFGIETFDGVTWKRNEIYDGKKKIYMLYILQKNKYHQGSYLIASRGNFGFLSYQNDQFQYTSLASKQLNDSIIGSHVVRILQLNSSTYFFGRKGFVVYNHQDNTLKVIKNNIDLSKKYRYEYFVIGQQIVSKGPNNQVLVLQNNQWQTSTKHYFLKKYNAAKFFELSPHQKLLISKSGDFYLSGKRHLFRKNDTLSVMFQGTYGFRIKHRAGKLFIKSHKKIAIYDLKQNKVIFLKQFKKARLTNFDIDKQGNFWVSSYDGIFFIETNIVFKARTNHTNTFKQYHIDDMTFDIKRNNIDVEVRKKGKSKLFKKLGLIHNIVKVRSNIYFCTTKGLYLFKDDELNKIYNAECYIILNYSSKGQNNLLFIEGRVLLLNARQKVVKEMSVPGLALRTIIFNNKIYYSTEDEAYRITLNNKGDSIVNVSRLKFPNRTAYDFEFFKTSDGLVINNAKGIYLIKEQNENKTIHLSKNIIGISRNKKGDYNVNFTYVYCNSIDSFFVVPLYIGEYNGKNIPGHLIKNAKGAYQWHNKPFKRLDKCLLSSITQTPQNTYELVANDHIIEYDPNKKIDVDYAFKTYIRSVQIKTKHTDTTRRKNILVDSIIYYGNAVQPPAPTLAYQHNTLTFTYASDSWAAYERNLYSYQLIGLDEGWSGWSTEQKKEYTHLREGTYTFRVRCKNIYGTISSVDSYTFTILPPWHRTIWAYALYVLVGLALLIGGSYGYSRYRSRQLYLRNQHLEQVVDERTQEILAQKEEISQQADMLQVTNDELKQANERIQREKDEKVKIYLQEATETANKLQQVRNTLAKEGSDEAQKILKQAISGVDEFVIIREKVRQEYPDFTERIDQALIDKKITKLVWQVGYCLKLGMLPAEVAEVLPTNNRSVSTHGSNLRRLGILDPIKKA
ncbi:triple tyrosine motif-containing protein [Microscilla marina]|uniref:Two component regulator three Y motif family n=1 Tax=Microscilla marina ATCC 23134 TaxID=313606 RepID=A1ZZX5_MICM2|nr:triple tyrosine motif-containing protein [Microscilla marina]EAY24063.1 Two component regulator three Y motif family [Microscilla marina ATCC 23134]